MKNLNEIMLDVKQDQELAFSPMSLLDLQGFCVLLHDTCKIATEYQQAEAKKLGLKERPFNRDEYNQVCGYAYAMEDILQFISEMSNAFAESFELAISENMQAPCDSKGDLN